ncbi:MAG: serine/threonine-protein kinase [Melioribacteraceae bacterium]|nr:serine/threonine-protein kinase [Melioribacteraceae bacterium]
MKVLINNKEYHLDGPIKFGGEGEIFTVNYDGEIKCVKIYDYEKRTSFNERKIFTLINKFRKMNLGGIENNIAFPEFPVYVLKTKRFCGFLMKYFNNHMMVSDLKYSNNTYSYGDTNLTDADALKLIDNLFFYLRVLHKAGFVLGDINPENILVDKSSLIPSIVDFDSVQVGSFFSNTRRNDFIDPNVKIDGHGRNKYFIYTTDSDIYSLSIIAYELVLGAKPHFFQTSNPTETNYKKHIGLSLLDYYVTNKDKIEKHSLSLEENDLFKNLFERLEYLKRNHNSIFIFFKSIFTEDKRYYYYYQHNRNIYIQKKDGKIDIEEIELISQSKTDPNELGIFLKQFNISIP